MLSTSRCPLCRVPSILSSLASMVLTKSSCFFKAFSAPARVSGLSMWAKVYSYEQSRALEGAERTRGVAPDHTAFFHAAFFEMLVGSLPHHYNLPCCTWLLRMVSTALQSLMNCWKPRPWSRKFLRLSHIFCSSYQPRSSPFSLCSSCLYCGSSS